MLNGARLLCCCAPLNSHDKCYQDSDSLLLRIVAFNLIDFGNLFLDNIKLTSVRNQYNFWLLDFCLFSVRTLLILGVGVGAGEWICRGWRGDHL